MSAMPSDSRVQGSPAMDIVNITPPPITVPAASAIGRRAGNDSRLTNAPNPAIATAAITHNSAVTDGPAGTPIPAGSR